LIRRLWKTQKFPDSLTAATHGCRIAGVLNAQ
jgi:hypothetical protein